MKEAKTQFREGEVKRPTLLGIFPGHVIDLKIGNFINESVPFNFLIKFASECSDIDAKNADGETVKAESMVGKVLMSVGAWFSETPKRESDNSRYVRFCEACGVEFEERDDAKLIGEVEKIDVLGAPVLAVVRYVVDSRDKEKSLEERRMYARVVHLQRWEEGEPLSLEELDLVPF